MDMQVLLFCDVRIDLVVGSTRRIVTSTANPPGAPSISELGGGGGVELYICYFSNMK